MSGETAGGTLRADAIHITGTDLGDNAQQGTIVDGTDTYFAHPNFSPQLAQHDTVALYVGTGHSYTVTLTDTLTNPVLHIGSLVIDLQVPGGHPDHQAEWPGHVHRLPATPSAGWSRGRTPAGRATRTGASGLTAPSGPP